MSRAGIVDRPGDRQLALRTLAVHTRRQRHLQPRPADERLRLQLERAGSDGEASRARHRQAVLPLHGPGGEAPRSVPRLAPLGLSAQLERPVEAAVGGRSSGTHSISAREARSWASSRA